jgi:1,2-diacylglycerol 3-beta-glucosyltransferase
MISALELFLISFGLTYYITTTGAGVVMMWKRGWGGRHRRWSGAQANGALAVPDRPGRLRRLLVTAEEQAPRASLVTTPEDFVTYFLVPCLNEELVIGRTIKALLADRRARVVVVDDGSDDATSAVAAAVAPGRVTVVRRELPEARLGKGPALNTGLAAILHDAAVHRIAASQVIICVMDADGELSPRALDEVLPLFSDPAVGGVQLGVKIRNTGSLLTTLQDLEFWGVAAIGQMGRNATGTVSLGGNGQFTRLTALLTLGREPWRPRLTEDLDLGLALSVAGWRLLSTPRAHVTQQGVPTVKALIRQRTRWYQGHLEASEWLGEVWSSPKVSHLAMIEITLYLMIPWVLVLPWSLCMNYNIVMTVGWWMGWAAGPPIGNTPLEEFASITVWYLTSFFPLWTAGFLYNKQRPGNFLRALLIGHLLFVGNYIAYVACWRALFRYLRGSRGWAKTKRVDEGKPALRPVVPTAVGPVPATMATAPLPARESVFAAAGSRR